MNKKYRGKHIGKQLIKKVFKLAQRDNLHSMQILTDESCNHEFYKQVGCKLVYSTDVENKEVCEEQAFIFEKKL